MSEKVIPKAYGSIPHLSTSKLTQQADKKIGQNQEDMLTKKTRDWKDLVVVTEKLDGSCCAIIKKGNELLAITRAGYLCKDSPYKQHHMFHEWVKNETYKHNPGSHLYNLPEGYRVCGEWLAQAHGTIYDLTRFPLFVAFDIIDDYGYRVTYVNFIRMSQQLGIQTVPLLHIGQPISVANALKLLGDGKYGNPDKPEGVVYRMEREGKVDFLAKWVRADKVDGKYLKDENGNELEIWNKGVNLA